MNVDTLAVEAYVKNYRTARPTASDVSAWDYAAETYVTVRLPHLRDEALDAAYDMVYNEATNY
jgi:hypothetical protein